MRKQRYFIFSNLESLDKIRPYDTWCNQCSQTPVQPHLLQYHLELGQVPKQPTEREMQGSKRGRAVRAWLAHARELLWVAQRMASSRKKEGVVDSARGKHCRICVVVRKSGSTQTAGYVAWRNDNSRSTHGSGWRCHMRLGWARRTQSQRQ